MKKIEVEQDYYARSLSLKFLRIMKLTMLLLTIACLQVAANTYSQERITLKMHTAELKKVLAAIEKKSNYRFLFSEDVVKDKPPVSIDVQDADINEVLLRVFNNTGISYRIMKTNLVVLKEAPSPAGIAIADITVTGKVTGPAGEPLSGVSVTVKGSSVGTATGTNGEYSITVPEAVTLVFSYVGFKQHEEPVNGRTVIDVVLQDATGSLDQVVVVGYGTQKKRDLTGTITSIKGEELAKMPNTNPVSSLQGKVAGLTIVNNGQAGASPTVRIRGVNSTNAADPLFVVDGVFQTNIDYLNPADIESIEVLRDPSSIAIFGLQGGNGVIIVTTKRASKGETRITFQSNIGIQKVTDKIDVTDAEGFKKLYSAQLANLNANSFDFTNYTANTDWQDLIFRDAVVNNNTLSISNSGEKSTTLFSLGYNTQEGVLKYDKFQKYIGRLNQEIKFTKNIKIGGDITGFHWIRQDPSANLLNNALWAAPIIPVQAGEGLYYSTPSFQRTQVGNPMARIDQNTGNAVNKGYRVVGNIFGEVKFLRHFTYRAAFYTDLGFNNKRSYDPLPFKFINLGENGGATDTTFNETIKTGVTQRQEEYRKYQQDHTLTFSKTFHEKHQVTALAGFTTLFQAHTILNGNRRDTLLNIPRDPDYWYLDNDVISPNNPQTNEGSGNEEAFMSFLGRVNYSFEGKYLVNASWRRDGSSKFGPDNRYDNFGSIGVGWVISDESFFNAVKHIDFLKLRAAWGVVGSGLNLPAGNLFQPGLTTSNVSVFGDQVYSSVSPAYVPAPGLHWERVRGIDIGVDIRALNNRLSTEVTFYDRTTNDIITEIKLPGTAGTYNYRDNLGTITNKGIEVSAGWNDRIGNDWSYRVNANFSYNRNKVESIGNDFNFEILRNGSVNKTQSGESVGYFYGYRQVGIYQTVAQLDKQAALATSLPGDIAYEDVNGDGVINQQDRIYLGTPFPAYNFGASLSLVYKGFDLLLEGQGVAGNKIYTQRRTAIFATLNYEANRLNAWTGPGTSNVEPVLDNTRGNNYLFSTYYLEPGDYFRFRTVQLGYTFSSKMISKIGMKQLRMYISGQNMATFSKTTGYTPEATIKDPLESGADNGTYPLPAVYSFGINATF